MNMYEKRRWTIMIFYETDDKDKLWKDDEQLWPNIWNYENTWTNMKTYETRLWTIMKDYEN